LPSNVVFAATSTRRMDAALMGSTAGRIGGLLMLTQGGTGAALAAVDKMKLRDNVDRLMVAGKP